MLPEIQLILYYQNIPRVRMNPSSPSDFTLSEFYGLNYSDRKRTFLLTCLKSRIRHYIDLCENIKSCALSMKQIAILNLFKNMDLDNLDLVLLRSSLCTMDDRGGICLDLIKSLVRLLFESISIKFEHDFNSYHDVDCDFSFHIIGQLDDYSYIHLWVCNECETTTVCSSFTYAMLVSLLQKTNEEMFKDLLKCGDVESNPGPTMSKFAISESGFRYRAQSLFEINHNHTLDDNMKDFISSLTNNVVQSVSSSQCYMSTACKLFLILNNLDNKLNLAAIFIDLLVSWNVTFSLAQQAWTFISKHCNPLLHNYRAQVASDGCIRALSLLITCIMSVIGTMALPCQKLIDLVLKRTGDIGRATTGFKTLLDSMSTVFDNVYSIVFEFITGIPPHDTALEQMLGDVREWFLEVDELVKIKVYDNISVSYKDCRRIEQAHMLGLEFIKRMDQMKMSAQHREPFNRYWTMLSKLYEKVIAYGARKAEPRTEPVVIRIFGKAGCGKSGLVFLLAQDLCSLEGMAENFMDELYFRNQVQEFWDGYCGQMVTVIDDFGQVRDSLGNINKEFLEVIRCKNIAKWPLHMASLEQKSRTNFISRAVILTSNELVYDTPSITCKDALARRMDITVECKIKDEFRVSSRDVKLDTSKVKSNMDPNVYEFIVYEDNKPTDIVLNYEQFSQVCCSAYTKAYGESRGRLEALRERGIRLDAKYKAQVDCGITVDRVICPAIWLSVRSSEYNHIIAQIKKDKILDDKQCDDLITLACSSDNYNDFMFEVYQYSVSTGIDLLANVKSDFNYNSLSSKIYDNDLTLNKRVTTQLKYVTEMFNRFKDTLHSYYESIRKGPALALITLGGIFTGLFAMYSLKSYVFPSRRAKSQPIPPSQLESKFSPESRDEKRPQKILRRECKAESRDEKRPRKHMRAEFFFPRYKCTCRLKTLRPLFNRTMTQLVNTHLDNSNCKCDGVFCLICFQYQEDVWLDPFLQILDTHKIKCDVCTPSEIAYNVLDEFINDPSYHTQALIDVNARETIIGPIANNLYKLATKTEDGWRARVNALFVRGTIVLTVKHARDWLADECKLYNSNVPDGFVFRKQDCQFIDLENRDGDLVDAMLIVLPHSVVPLHRDIVKNFTDNYDINKFNVTAGNLIHLRSLNSTKGGGLIFGQYVLKNITAIDQEQYVMTDEYGKSVPYVVRDGYEYDAETENGDCGSPLVASNNMLKGKILGIHVAGAANSTVCSALATPLSKSMLDRGLAKVSSYVAQLKLDVDYQGMCALPDGNFIPLGQYTHTLPAPSKSNHSKSPLHEPMLDYRESTKKPAILKPMNINGEMVNPLMKGLAKCGGVSPLIDTDLLDRCVVAVANFLRRNRDATLQGPLTVEQAIRGIPGHPYIRSINRASSPGVPFVFQKKTNLPGKQEWLGTQDEFRIDHPDLVRRLALRLELAQKGERLETIWADTLKDELRPIAKVEAGKTRVFSAGPMDYVIFMRQYYLPFFSHMMHNRINNFSAVGINPFDLDWHRLALKLKSYGVHVIDGDFENFDGTLLSSFLWSVCHVINMVEDDGCDRIREVIFTDIVNSVHLHGNNLYAWTHSLTSGNPGTAIINTVYNILSMVYAFCKCTGKPAVEFFKDVYMIAYGDDNVLNISSTVIDQFNMQTIAKEYAKIGMKYTDAHKSEELCKFNTFDNISFLKRSFRYDTILMRHIAPLQLDTILEMTMWVTNASDPHSLCSSNVERAYYELALHGKSTFTEWSNILNKLSQHYVHRPPVLGHFLDYLGKDFGY